MDLERASKVLSFLTSEGSDILEKMDMCSFGMFWESSVNINQVCMVTHTLPDCGHRGPVSWLQQYFFLFLCTSPEFSWGPWHSLSPLTWRVLGTSCVFSVAAITSLLRSLDHSRPVSVAAAVSLIQYSCCFLHITFFPCCQNLCHLSL